MNMNIISGNNAASSNSPEPFVGFDSVTRHLGVSKRTIQYHMKRGLPYYSIGRLIRFRLSEIDRWLATKLRIDTNACKIDLSGPDPTITIKHSR
jgi:excisionase family DNA binding protein